MRDDKEVNKLVQENLGLVGAVVNRTRTLSTRIPGGYDREDLEGLGRLGLLRAAQTFDPKRGAAFSTYAYRCIEHTIFAALKREATRQIECISLSVLCDEEEGHPLEDLIADPNADPAGRALDLCARTAIERAISGLPERQGRVIRAIYFEGESISQVAASWRLSMQAVQNLHVLALKGLRRQLYGVLGG